MKRFKHRAVGFAGALLMGCLLPVLAHASELTWLTDLEKAQVAAKAENKRVLVNFTGSDWCGFCIKLHKEVFDTKEFADYAKKNLVLVEVDFPQKKKLPPAQQKANDALNSKYKVEGFPTILVLGADGKTLGREVGYGPGTGPKNYINKLDSMKAH